MMRERDTYALKQMQDSGYYLAKGEFLEPGPRQSEKYVIGPLMRWMSDELYAGTHEAV